MLITHAGACQCTQIEFQLSLPEPLLSYSPRACDCDFCSQHDVLFLSDPRGSLNIISTISLDHHKQGSQQAEFLSCKHCEQVVAVVSNIDGVLKGSLNADCLYDFATLAQATPVSPESLCPADRKARWSKLWMPVTVSEPD